MHCEGERDVFYRGKACTIERGVLRRRKGHIVKEKGANCEGERDVFYRRKGQIVKENGVYSIGERGLL